MKQSNAIKPNFNISYGKRILKEHLVIAVDKVDITKVKYFKKGPYVMQLAYIVFLNIKLYYLSVLITHQDNKVISKAYLSEDAAMALIEDIKNNKIKL